MLSPGSDAAQVQEGLASLLQRNCSFLFFFFYYYFLSWTHRVKSDTLSRAGPQPLLLCNCCSGGTGPARSRPPPSFRAEGFFPHHPPPSGSGVCVCVHRRSAPTSSSSQPLQRAWPACLLHFPGGDTDPDLPVPSLFLLTGFFPTCTSGYCGTTGWGRVGGSPPPPSNPPGSSLCLSSCGKPGPQKCFMFL